MRARLGAAGLWGLVGVLALLANAIVRLSPYAFALRHHALRPAQWALFVVWFAFMGYSEGYRAFHQNFSPRVVARAQHLSAHPRPIFVAIAPLYCMGLVHATRKRLIVSWSVTIGIIGLVVLVRQLAQPWRGIIDGGVVVGLTAGIISILYYSIGQAPSVPPDVPG